MNSPALSMTSDMTDEELDKYFATYVPLSNLPTPPPAKEPTPAQPCTPSASASASASASSEPRSASTQSYDIIPSQNEVYAIHLTNLVPLNVSTHRPHASAIQGFLDRAELPEEIVAFSACVLDALTSRFASTWRDALVPAGDQTSDCHDLRRLDPRHTLPVSPDVIVLAALSLAHGFLVDRMRSTLHWSIKESRGAFSVREIEATKRAMLQDMDYGLWRISNDTLQRRLKNMQRAKTLPAHTCTSSTTLAKHRRRNVSLSLQGAAIWQHGVQTPEPSP